MAALNLKLNNGLTIPQFGLGTLMSTLQPDDEPVINMVLAAIEIGYRHFDTAFVYGNEKGLGVGLQKAFEKGLVKREELFITTKLWRTKHREEDVLPALKKSLENLNLSYVDLYLIHWPSAYKNIFAFNQQARPSLLIKCKNVLELNKHVGDANFPVENGKIVYDESLDYVNTWKSMEKCVELGLTKSIGLSNFNIQQIQRVLDNCQIPPATNQFESHPYLVNKRLVDFCKQKNIVVCVFAPLGGNSAKVEREKLPVLYENQTLKEIAKKHNCTAAQVALKYQLQRGVVILPKSEKKSRLLENWEAQKIQLSGDDIKAIEALDRKLRIYDEHEDHLYYPFNEEY